MNQEKLFDIASHFALEGAVASVEALGEGFINDTFVVKTSGSAPNYILQRKNHIVFPDVPGMMDNIKAVTEHIKAKVTDPMRETLTVVPATDGKLYHKDGENYWAVCIFIPDTVTYDRADSTALAYQGGVGIGRFQALLSDFTSPLNETIKGFHNIRWRFEQWDATIAADPAGRVKDLQQEIEWVESRREEMLSFWSKVETGEIPTHVTHNDTKISNILFDRPTGNVLCAIDLDTVMSSTSLNDFGDAIRSYTNTGAEDDKCLDNVEMSIDMFRAYAEGYLSEQRDSMCASEKEWLAFAGRYITFEQVLRFLMDYIDGDKYYKIAYPDHNLVRTRAQYKLLQSMERQYEEMCAIVKELA
ncbi:MAG: aminoglycoside phosphotransferase family protein [Alistipes sp.]|nr:aminoglycoside phosphotransferase family protein [Alistipes sp.]MBQ5922277.1 aminoglycoside phosphotransferase family protein [Alistipes sp.]